MKLLDCTCVEEFMQWSLVNQPIGTLVVTVVREYSVGYADACDPIDTWLMANMSWLVQEITIVDTYAHHITISLNGHYYSVLKHNELYSVILEAKANDS